MRIADCGIKTFGGSPLAAPSSRLRLQHDPACVFAFRNPHSAFPISTEVGGDDDLQPLAEAPALGTGEDVRQRLRSLGGQPGQGVENLVQLRPAGCRRDVVTAPRQTDLCTVFEPTLGEAGDDADRPLAGRVRAGADMNPGVGVQDELNHRARVRFEFAHDQPVVLRGLAPVDAARRVPAAVRPDAQHVAVRADLRAGDVPLYLPAAAHRRDRPDRVGPGPDDERRLDRQPPPVLPQAEGETRRQPGRDERVNATTGRRERPAAQSRPPPRGRGDPRDRLGRFSAEPVFHRQPPRGPRQPVTERQPDFDGFAFRGPRAVECDRAGQPAQRHPRPDHPEGDHDDNAAAKHETLGVQEQPAEQRRDSRRQQDAERVCDEPPDLRTEPRRKVVGRDGMEPARPAGFARPWNQVGTQCK